MRYTVVSSILGFILGFTAAIIYAIVSVVSGIDGTKSAMWE